MERDKLIKLISVPLFLFCITAFAEQGSYGDADSLQKERYLYELQAARNKAKQEAESYSDTASSSPNGSTATAPGRVVDELPSLMKINGRKAVVSLADGSTRSVSIGEMLPGGRYQMNSITLSGVSVRRISDGKILSLN
jgi:type IV pilus biogenesis protein PilP